MENIYMNACFTKTVTCFVGNNIRVHTVTKEIFEGIFKAFSPKFDVVVSLVHKVNFLDSLCAPELNINDTLIFKVNDIVEIEIIDAEIDRVMGYHFRIDSAISPFGGAELNELKELIPWDISEENIEEYVLDESQSDGWDPNEMFQINEAVLKTKINFDDELTLYTMPLKESNGFNDKKIAEQIAKEIENNPIHKDRMIPENDDGNMIEWRGSSIPTSRHF